MIHILSPVLNDKSYRIKKKNTSKLSDLETRTQCTHTHPILFPHKVFNSHTDLVTPEGIGFLVKCTVKMSLL